MKKLLFSICLLLPLLLNAIDVEVVAIDNTYDRTTTLGNWERNHTYTVQVVLKNTNSSAQAINMIEANVIFDTNYLTHVSHRDIITNWNKENYFIVSPSNYIQYMRAPTDTDPAIIIPGNGSLPIYEVTFHIGSTAPLGTTPINLAPQFTNIMLGLSDLTGSLINRTITIVLDSTPPVTQILPAANMHLASSIPVTLGLDPNPATNCNDLQSIHYTTDGSNPTLGSPVYTGAITLPANTTTSIKWFSVDQTNNQEDIRTAVYRVDTTPPVVNNIIVLPTEPLFLRSGARVTVSFDVIDDVELNAVGLQFGSQVGNYISKIGNTYTYSYTIPTIPTPTDGYRAIIINTTDHAGNQTTNSSHGFYVDNTPPLFSCDYITPPSANNGAYVEFQFTASEELDLSRTTVSIGTSSPASLVSNTGLQYCYSRVIDGTETSGWIMVYGSDRAGNVGFNLEENNKVHITGYDLQRNSGEGYEQLNIRY